MTKQQIADMYFSRKDASGCRTCRFSDNFKITQDYEMLRKYDGIYLYRKSTWKEFNDFLIDYYVKKKNEHENLKIKEQQENDVNNFNWVFDWDFK